MGSVLDKNSSIVRKRIESHTFEDENGEEYEGSKFHGFGDYFRRKKLKLQNKDADTRTNSDKPQIFKGIVAHVTGYTQPPLHVLHRDIVEHGGGFLQYLDSKTMATHIIASTLPPKKSVDFSRYRIVKPAWITESIAAGKVLPWSDYRVLGEGPRQKVLRLDGSKGLSQTSPTARQGYREQTENSFYTSQLRASVAGQEAIGKVETPDRFVSSEANSTERESSSTLKLADYTTPSTEVAIPDFPEFSPETDTPTKTLAQRNSTHVKKPPKEFSADMTPEEHNAWLLSDPRLRESSCANPNFLTKFYAESRLHHLSTWKAELKSSMQRLAVEKGLSEKKFKTQTGARRYIMHVDFDSFFCAVSLKKYPEYMDKPVAVAHGTGNGSEIASCNYPARSLNVKNGMWMKRAMELCPDLKVLPYDFPAYEAASKAFYEAIMTVGGVVQSVSIDEALIDATAIVHHAAGSQGVGVEEGSVWREQEKVEALAADLRQKINELTGCNVSIGIGGNILQAKVALRKAKPAGQYQLRPEEVLDFIGELKVEQLPGVSYSIGGKLEELGIRFVKDLRDLSKERLTSILGPKTGERLAEYARGIDQTEVGGQPPRKSVSAEVSWGIRFITQQEAEDFVLNLCKELERRLLNELVKGRHLTVKIMRRSLDAPLDPAKHLGHGKCDTFNKSVPFGVGTHNAQVIGKEAIAVLRSYRFSPGDLRGLGVQMTKLESIKPGTTASDGSQKRLEFTTFVNPASAKKTSGFGSIDDVDSLQRPRFVDRRGSSDDPITDDPLTPRKPRVHPAMALAKAREDDIQAKTPLNIGGTQFLIPSNIDPTVVAELPNDIRSRLMAQKSRSSTPGLDAQPKSRSESPAAMEFLPSQVDAEVFNALPDDMRAEVLAQYGRKPPARVSVKKDSQIQRNPSTPTKRGGHKGAINKAQRERDTKAGVVQTSFMTEPIGDGFMDDVGELDPQFLAELPEDVRREVVADHKRQKLAQRSGLDAPSRRPAHAEASGSALFPTRQRKIQFPARPPRVSFSSAGVRSTAEMKDLLDAWHADTRRDGPHRSDLDIFEKYIARVVAEERDMDKAATLVKWLDVLVEQDGDGGRGRDAWRKSMAGIQAVLQEALRKRGLGPV
ncbi:DNA damage repair protein Mus42, putative [Cordyceps militaris CM01]|uniref:DNA repair protein REV1 n=1 Tax=Cordyceps militaris (strain CM01) TaxID=983644 RepID=G3JHQ2_CORMM|nr:DNA damage repair protein Mus42, putative [Cordyceps militaris CM01]EGX91758.1 DNA damage repair protein Mus42, putative [Cordyceps militaris CM01]